MKSRKIKTFLKSFKKSPKRILLLSGVVLFLLSFVLGFFVGAQRNIPLRYELINKEPKVKKIDFSLFWEVWDKIHYNFLHAADDKNLFYSSIKGLIAGTNDPYSAFLTPKETEMFTENMEEEFYGVGIEIGVRDGKIIVISPLANTPAEKVGLLSGDEIVAVDGKPTENQSLMEVVSWIRGKKGTEVILSIKRKGWREPKDFKIKRAKIENESVKTRLLGDILYIKIVQFSEKTYPLFYQALSQSVNKDLSGVIIDLRQNPGGYFQAAVDIASLFIEKGPIVFEKDKAGNLKDYQATKKPIFKDYSVVILVDSGSASASEILAGALKDYNKAIVIGEKTFGKGVMQSWERFNDGSSLILTTAYWLTPKKHQIDGKGITPDVIIKSEDKSCSDKDKVCQKAIELLTK